MSRVAPLAPPWSEEDAAGIQSWGHPDRTYEPLLLVRCLQRHPKLAAKLRESVESAFPGGFAHITGAELSERLSQEANLFALRIDVAEELSRLHSHLAELRQLIGKGGAVIRALTEETGTQIDISDDGTIVIASVDEAQAKEAQRRIVELTADVEVGQIYEGSVLRLLDFGAIVQVLPGRDGLLHISEIANYRIANINDVLKVGQQVRVKVIEADDKGRLRLSIKAIGGIEQQQAGGEAPAQSEPQAE